MQIPYWAYESKPENGLFRVWNKVVYTPMTLPVMEFQDQGYIIRVYKVDYFDFSYRKIETLKWVG